jgi:hypothetical protein
MKGLITFLICMSFGVLTGCNNMNSVATTDVVIDNPLANTCCNDENFQSGYYYNGYKENGWRYCVVKPKVIVRPKVVVKPKGC